MKTIQNLKREARESALFRGHSMTKWEKLSENLFVSQCRYCGKEVCVNSKPLPNEINIGGEAVALNCQ